jgi:hypothetical protein
MQYLALLFGPEGPSSEPGTPEFEAELVGYEKFHQLAGDAIVCGEALHPSRTAVTIRPGDGRPLVTAGPFTEAAEVVGGFYVLEADSLDDAIELARNIPATQEGATELWPMVMWAADAEANRGPDRWLALLVARADEAVAPGTADWETGASEHGAFAAAAGSAIVGGGALHPPTTATTVRVRNHEVLVTDGPYAETAEVANGLYLLRASSAEAATEVASRIPVTPGGGVELRRIVDLGG